MTDTFTPNAEASAEEDTEARDAAARDQFGAAFADAVESADPATGVVPEASIDLVKVAYRGLSRKDRNTEPDAAYDAVQSEFDAAESRGDMPNVGAVIAAGRLRRMLAEVKSVKPASTRVVDPVETAANALARLTLASMMVRDSLNGDADAVNARVDEILAANAGTPFGTLAAMSIVKRVANVSAASGERRPISKEIGAVLAASNEGDTYTVAEMVTAVEDMFGGDVNPPSVDYVLKDAAKVAKLGGVVCDKDGNRAVRVA